MKSKNSTLLTVFIVLVFSMMWTFPVLADEGQPQGEEPTVTETSPVEEPTVTETAPADEQSAPEATINEEPALSEGEAVSAPVEETLLEQLPENTTVVVTDENGNPMPLVTQEAAEAVSTMPDPRWCPASVVPGGAGCSPVFTHFNGTGGLLEWLTTNNPGVAGVIWVEAAYDSSVAGDTTAIILDGSVLTNMALQALTINGGWSGLNNTVLNPNDLSEFNVPFRVINWTGAVTLNNLLITGASGGSYPLTVFTKGNITVNNVDVVDNTTDLGAYLDNNDDPAAIGNVTVNDSNFNGNTGTNASGLIIYSNGMVTLKNITTTGNEKEGLYIDNTTAATPKTVTLTGSNQFIGNGGHGLYILSDGIITLSNITAQGNGLIGAYLTNDFVNITNGVILKGASSFNHNGWDGLNIYSNGAITLANITANDNGTDPSRPAATDQGGGFYEYDAAGKGAVIYNETTLSPKGVTLTGVNTFNGNASNGLVIESAGLILVNNLTADDNGCDAAFDKNDYYCAGAFLWGAGVTLTGYGNFNNNAFKGLHTENHFVLSANSLVGAITLNNVLAQGNANTGVYASTDGSLAYNITLLGINTFLNNGFKGLDIDSNGIVALTNITANGNTDAGVYVDNTLATSAKGVTLNLPGTYIGNKDGLVVYSKGTITTNGLMALDNTGYGVFLDNCIIDAGLCTAFASQSVNVNGVNTVSNNGSSGLDILSRGAVNISSLTAISNASTGAMVDNQFNNAVGGITFKNYANSFNNGTLGIVIYSRGAVSLINVRADSNTGTGLFIDNFVINTLRPNVAITGTNSFSYNNNHGLVINTYGVVTLSNVFANGNTNYGALIDNYHGDGSAANGVTLTGTNFFNGNGSSSGLDITSLGAVVLNKITASFNGDTGVIVNNQWNKFSQPVTIAGYGVFNGNGYSGISIYSNGNVTLANLFASNNAADGLYVSNNSLTLNPTTTAQSVNVSLTGVNSFNQNQFYGVSINSDGAVTLNSVTANDNGEYGLYVDNVTYTSVGKGLTLSGWNNFFRNGNTGLYFKVSGNVVLNRVVSSYNGDAGGPNSAKGIDGTAGGTITLVCASLNNNEAQGYLLSAPGKLITLTGVFAYANGAVSSATGTPITVSRICTLP